MDKYKIFDRHRYKKYVNHINTYPNCKCSRCRHKRQYISRFKRKNSAMYLPYLQLMKDKRYVSNMMFF